MSFYSFICQSRAFKGTMRMLLMLMLLAALISSFSIPVSATPAWTNAWTIIGSNDSDGLTNPFGIAADQVGNVYVTNGNEIKKLVTGDPSWQPVINTGLSASPNGIAVDKDGNLYITDSSKSVVQQLDSEEAEWKAIGGRSTGMIWVPGHYMVYDGSTIWVDGAWQPSTENSGGIYVPFGVAVDEDLNVYVANRGNINYSESYNSLAMLKEGDWTILGASSDGKVPCYIADVATDNSGNVYVTTQYSSGTGIGQDSIRIVSGGEWRTMPRTYVNDPINPDGIAVDHSGHIYVVSRGDRTVKVFAEDRWISISGSDIGGPKNPNRIAVDGSGNIYVTDSTNKLVWKLQAPATKLVWETQPTNGTAGHPWANPPKVALVDANGHVETGVNDYTVTLTINSDNGARLSGATATFENGIATFDDLTVNKVDSGYTLTPSCSLSPNLVGESSDAFNMDAPPLPTVNSISPSSGIGGTRVSITGNNFTAASLVKFGEVAGVNLVVKSDTSIEVTAPSQGAGMVNISVTTPGGESLPFGYFTYNQPGVWTGSWTKIADDFDLVRGLAIDKDDNIYVVEHGTGLGNGKLKKLDGNTWYTPVTGLSYPKGVAVDATGYTYVADYDNMRIMWNSTEMVKWTDNRPRGVALDKSGNVYATVNTSGGASVLKYNGTNWSDITYDGAFSVPQDVAVDKDGNVYVVDSYLNLAKKLSAGTTQWEIIGTGFDGGPEGIMVDGVGNVYVADTNNNVIKELRVGSTQWANIGGLTEPYDIALDSQGNLNATAKNAGGSGGALYMLNAPATQLVWDTQPGDSPAGQTIQPYPKLTLKDAKGNVINGNSTDTVTLSLYSNNGASLEGLAGTTTVTMVNGTADFVDIRISQPGSGYRLVPSCSVSDIAIFDSESFTITGEVAPTPPLVWTGGWTTIGSSSNDFGSITGIAVDDSMQVYAVDKNRNNVKIFDGENWKIEFEDPDLNNSYGLALHEEDIYTADFNNRRILKYGNPFTSLDSLRPNDVAVDKLGNVYTCGYGTGMKVLKYEDSKWSSIEYNTSFSYPKGLALDNGGNLYVTDSINKDIKMLPAGTKQWKTIGIGFAEPEGITVDNSGNAYVADGYQEGEIKVLVAGTDQWVSLPNAGTMGVNDVSVDKYGNVYVSYMNNVYKHQAPATKLVWDTQPVGGIGKAVWDQQPVVSLRDANDNILTGDSSNTVTITLNPVNGATPDGSTYTRTAPLVKGVACFSGLQIDELGTYTLTLSTNLNDSIECPESNPFNITAGAVDQAQSKVTASETELMADNSDSAVITVTLKDAYGNPIREKTVALTQGSGSSFISPAESITDDGGNAMFWVKNTKIEMVTYTVTETTDNLTITETAQISFKAGAVNAKQSTLEANKTTVVADNSDSPAITVTLKDASGNPIEGKLVTLLQEEGNSYISPVNGISDETGKVVFTVKNTKAETIIYTAVSDDITLEATVQVAFIPGPAKEFIIDASDIQIAGIPFDVTVKVKDQYGNTVTDYIGKVSFSTDNGNSPGGWTPIVPDSYSFTQADAGIRSFSSGVTFYNTRFSALTVVDENDSSIIGKKEEITVNADTADTGTTTVAAETATVTANGSDNSTITVTVKDTYGNPVSGKTVILEQGSGSSVITPVQDDSQADGTAVFVVKSTKAETIIYTAVTDDITLEATVQVAFIPGPAKEFIIDASDIQIAGIPFDVTVKVKDQYGNTVTDYIGKVSFSTDNGNSPGGWTPIVPDSYSFTQADAGIRSFSSGVTFYNTRFSALTVVDENDSSIIGKKEEITVNADTADTGTTTVAAETATVTANGSDNSTITVTVKDTYGNPVSGKTVILEQGSGSSVITPVQDDSQADGTAVFVVKSTKAEIVVYTVKVDGATQGATVAIDFVPGLAESLIVEAAGSQKAGVPFNVTVTAKDLHGNTATGYRGTVELTSMDSQAVLPGSYAFSETDQGTYIFNGVILKTSGSRIITAEDIDNDSIRGATGNITVGPDTESGQSTIAADKPVVIADSKDKVNITVTLRDVYGNPVRGKTVNLSQGSGISVVEAVYGTSSHMDGTVLFTVASTKAETVKYTAMVDEKAVTEAVEVTFLSGTAAQLEWEIQPGGGSAGQIWPQQPVLVLKDSYGNVNTGDNSSEVTVVLKYGDEAILGGTKTVTFKNGEAIFNDLQIDTMGSYKLTPTITMNGIDSTDSNIFRISLVPAPSIKPNGGTFSGPVTVGLDYPEEYEAYYSLDEKTPNQDAIFYDGPFTIFSNSTVSATVCDTVYGEWSQTSRAEFIIQLSTPTADVEDGSTIENKSTVKLSAAVQGATIYYTTDGSTPNTNSSSGNIVKIIGTEGTIVTLKAYAVKADYKESKVVEFRYFIKQTDSSNNDGDNDSTGDSSSGDSGGSRTPAQGPQTEISFVGNVVTATKTVTAAFDSRGNTMATVSLTQVNDAIGQAQKEAERLGEDTVARVEIKVEAPADATAVTTNIPQEAVSQATVAGIDALKVVTPIAVITFDANALSALAVEVADEVKIRVSKVDASSLSLEAQQKVGDRPILDVNVNSGGRTISQFGGDVFVSLPYAPKAGEDTEAIVIYYINALGDLEIVSDCLYDPVTGRISFSTRHFSQYAVGYNKVTFKDVTENAWYSKAVGFIAAREITLGTGDGKFSPDAKLTRGTFMVMLLKAYGIAPDRDPKDNFADAGDTYYTGYLAVAKRLKISAGVGDNMFAPCEQITRQEMFTLLYNALKSIGRLPEGKAGEPLSSFADVENVASWAKEAMTLLAETGTIGGNEGKLSPTSTTTRAEMAQVLYNLLHHHPQTLSFFVSSSNVEAVTLLTRSEVSCK